MAMAMAMAQALARGRLRGRASSFSVIILFYYFLFYTTITISFQVKQAESKSKSECNESFNCGKLGVLGFPLSDNAKCGLFMINCTSSPPFILLGNGHILEVVNIISTNKFSVVYPRLRNLLEERNCLSLLTLPPFSPLISFSIYPNISLRSCLKNRTLLTETVPSRGCKTYDRCADVDLCYGDPPEPSNISDSDCKNFQMPAVSSNTTSAADLFQVLSYRFDLELNVSDDCLSCHNKGGTCLTDAKNQFWCKVAESDRRTVILVSAICASVAFLGLSILLYRCKKKTKGAYLLSRNISSATPLTSELEFGGRLYFGVPIFPYQELEEATDNFDPSKELGDGGFGTIYYGKLQDGREVAIKRLYEHNCNRVEQFMNEINILTGLRHPNLVTLYGCTSRRSQELLLVYEYIPNGTVADHLHGKIGQRLPLMWPLRMSIAIETAAALGYLHRSGIIHRDVKTSNILLDKNFCVKVADFGLSKLLPCDVTHISTSPQGTPGYVDPEYHQCYQLTDKSDVYSFGVVLIELISSMRAVDLTRDKYEINLANLALDRIQRCAFDELIDSSLGYPIDAEVTRMTTSVAELAFQCLQLEQELRPSMEEVLAFLKDIEAGDGCDLKNRKRDNGNGNGNGNGEYCMVEKEAMMSRSRSRSCSETKEGSVLVLVRGNIDQSSSVPVTVTDSWPSAGSTTTSSIP